MILSRRVFTLQALALPLIVSACAKPKTPLAHLYGQGWVHGAYEYYGKTYFDLQKGSEEATFESYRVLAQRGVGALDGLQLHEVPFNIHVDTSDKGFVIARDVPERLTFRADMTDADRQAAQAAYEKAREHIHTDYEEVRRLEWSLTRLLEQLQRVRTAIDSTRDEQLRLTRQITEVKAGTLPFPLPYQVTTKDYEEVLFLLIERLDSDRSRLEGIESAVATVGLTVRATDAGSASLAANIRKVLLSIVDDATDPRPIAFPDGAEREKYLAKGNELFQGILTTPEYKAFLTKDRDQALDEIGTLLTILDHTTHVPASPIYKLVLNAWRGNQDYLVYLKTVAGLIPGGGHLAKTVEQAIGITEKVRQVAGGAKGDGVSPDALLNMGTKFSRGQVGKQLAFFKDTKEAKDVEGALGATGLMKNPMPKALENLPDVPHIKG